MAVEPQPPAPRPQPSAPPALEVPRPRPTPTTRPYWDALAQERVALQRCDACGAWVHHPRVRCPRCLSDALAWHDVAGTGVVHTFTVARYPTAPMFADRTPLLLAVVELDEGVRMTTTLVHVDPADVRVGMPVAPVFDHGDDGVTLLRHRPAHPR
jgi:uncharacterized OB-fold protein